MRGDHRQQSGLLLSIQGMLVLRAQPPVYRTIVSAKKKEGKLKEMRKELDLKQVAQIGIKPIPKVHCSWTASVEDSIIK